MTCDYTIFKSSAILCIIATAPVSPVVIKRLPSWELQWKKSIKIQLKNWGWSEVVKRRRLASIYQLLWLIHVTRYFAVRQMIGNGIHRGNCLRSAAESGRAKSIFELNSLSKKKKNEIMRTTQSGCARNDRQLKLVDGRNWTTK